jgi:hypothetical protein
MASTSQSFAAESERLSCEAFQKVDEAEKEASRTARNGLLSGAEAARKFQFKLAEIIGTNIMASWDLWLRLAAAKAPSEAFELWAIHAKQQLTDIGQKFATASGWGPGLKAPSIVND